MLSLSGSASPGQRIHFSKLNLEWDETGQALKLRRGIIEVDGVMPVLVA